MPSMAHLLEMRSDQLENVTDQDGAVSRMFTSNPEKISAFLHFPNITSGTDSLS
jgi:type VI secretion system secreted protein VgrG